MARWEFYDNDEYNEGADEGSEPSFSLYEFKKWLSKQKKIRSFKESVEEKPADTLKESKEELKEAFKQKVRARVERNIERKMKQRKKKED